MDNRNKHNWVTFQKPRNGRVQISACAKCGVAKDFGASSLSCVDISTSDHRMKKLGWEIKTP